VNFALQTDWYPEAPPCQSVLVVKVSLVYLRFLLVIRCCNSNVNSYNQVPVQSKTQKTKRVFSDNCTSDCAKSTKEIIEKQHIEKGLTGLLTLFIV
jgi:hypothetical protein